MRYIAVALLAAGSYLCNASASAADIPSLGPYLGTRFISLQGPCSGTHSTRLPGTFQQDPAKWNSGWQFIKEESNDVYKGAVVNEDYYMNGVSKYYKYSTCNNSANYGYTLIPAEYVHRFYTQVWACSTVGAGCIYSGATTTDWYPGTYFK